MNFTDREKELLLENNPVYSRIKLYDENNSVLQVFTEDDYIIDWDYEDYRYVPDQGFIGQFVARILDGHFMNIPDNISLEDKEIELEIAVKDPELEEQVYHSYGRFIITKIEKEDASGSYKFEASDYTKKFNVAYESSVDYPCLAIDLLNNVAIKAEVDIEGNDICFAYAVGEEGLTAGNYCFSTYVNDTLTYLNFTTEKNLSYRDSLMLVVSKGKVIQRVVNEDFSISETEIVYASSTTQVGTLLSSEALRYIDFVNNNFVIDSNQFEEGQSCREVVCAIAKLGYTWARIGTDNKLYLDFVKKVSGDVDEHDEIDTDKYYEATVTGDKVEPINKVLIGMSQVEGENICTEQSADKIKLDKMYGDTSQDTYTGKNLLNPKITNVTRNGITVTYDDANQTINFNGTCTTDNTTFTFVDCSLLTFEGQYTLSYEVLDGTITNPTSMTRIQFQQSSVWTGIWLSLTQNTNSTTKTLSGVNANANNIRFDNGVAVSNYKIRIQVEKSSAKTSWERYVGGIPSPNPDYSQPVNTVTGRNVVNVQGKNLVNYDNNENLEHKYINDSGNWSINNSVWYINEKIEIDNTNSYSISFSERIGNGSYIRLAQFKNDGTFITRTLITTNSVLTPNNQCAYIIVSIDKADDNYFENLMLNKGEEALPYEPYQSQEYEIDLGKNLFDKDNANVLNMYISGNKIAESSYNRLLYIPCKPNTTYTLQKLPSPYSKQISYTSEVPAVNVSVGSVIEIGANGTTGTITTGANAKYLVCRFYQTSQDTTITLQQMLDSVQIEEGSMATDYAPYHTPIELCELDDYQNYDENTINLYDYTKSLVRRVFTQNGVTVTNNYDGSFMISGSGTLSGAFGGQFKDLTHAQTIALLKTGTLYFKCGQASMPKVLIEGMDGSNTRLFTLQNDTNDTKTVNITQAMLDNTNFYLRLSFYAPSGATITPCTVYPMAWQTGDGTFEPIKFKKKYDYITKSTGANIFIPTLTNNDTEIYKSGCNIDLNGDEYVFTATGTDMMFNAVVVAGSLYENRFGTLYPTNGASKIYFNCTNPLINKNYVTWFDENKTSLGYEGGAGNNNKVFNVPSNAKYFTIRFGYGSAVSGTVYKTRVMVSYSPITNYEPHGQNEWYEYHNTGKYVLTGASNENWYISGNAMKINALNTTLNYPLMDTAYTYSGVTTQQVLSNYGVVTTAKDITDNTTPSLIGLGAVDTGGGTTDAIYLPKGSMTVADFKTKLSTNPLICYYLLKFPEVKKITYQPLIDQLNAVANTYEGKTYITSRGVEVNPKVDITVTNLDQDTTSYTNNTDYEINGHEYEESELKIYDNPLTYTEELRRIAINGAEKLYGLTYTPMTINSIGHPWLEGDDFVKLTNLEENDLYTYPFDRKLEYKGYLVTDLSSSAENQVQDKYENPNNVLNRLNHTEISVDKANQRIDLIAEQTSGNTQNITNMQLDINGINQSVQHIEDTEIAGLQSQISTVNQTMNAITNMFQISGGINVIRNSAFLLQDAVWEFTNNGTNPYYTPLGSSYNVALSGTTTSVAEIKLRSVKVKSKSENVTNLILGTKYTFNFYHKQDNNMTTTIKMYSTENNNVKAFDDIVITGQQGFRNYEVSFTPTTYANYTIEIIVTSTASVGYAYIYDMMLNSGDKQSWQPASDEIYSTTLQMSRLGLQVYSVGDGTITILGSDGMATYETTDGKTLGRLVSLRNIDGDRTRVITTQAVYLTKDITQENDNKWVETIVTISGSPYKVEYVESGE